MGYEIMGSGELHNLETETSLRERVRLLISGEGKIVKDIPFVAELELSRRDINWIAGVRETARWEAQRYPTEGRVSTYEIVKLYLMIQRDIKRGLQENERTGQKLDEIATNIIEKIFEDPKSLWTSSRGQLDEILTLCRSYPGYTTFKDKFACFSRLLDFVHNGGRMIVIQRFFYGIPPSGEKASEEAYRFLTHLNHLGMVGEILNEKG